MARRHPTRPKRPTRPNAALSGRVLSDPYRFLPHDPALAPEGRPGPRDVVRMLAGDVRSTERGFERAATPVEQSAVGERHWNRREALGALVREVCEPSVYDRGPCDRTVREVRGERPRRRKRIPCPRLITTSGLRAMDVDGMEPLGPYDSPLPHSIAESPCCYYHPTSIERLRFREAASESFYKRRPRATEAEFWRAMAEAENSHPMKPVWDRCDDDVAKAVMAISGRNAHLGVPELVRRFYAAAPRADDYARNTWRTITDSLGIDVDFNDAVDRDLAFIEAVNEAMMTSDNRGDVVWWIKRRAERGRPVSPDAAARAFKKFALRAAATRKAKAASRPAETRRKRRAKRA